MSENCLQIFDITAPNSAKNMLRPKDQNCSGPVGLFTQPQTSHLLISSLKPILKLDHLNKNGGSSKSWKFA